MTYVIAQPCVDIKDKACLDVCPVDCIYEGVRTLYINPDECIDCQACEPVCPVEAIYAVDDLPDEYRAFARINEEFFTEVADIRKPLGGWEVGRLDVDHPDVAALPPS